MVVLLAFSPLGKTTSARKSTWPSPSFDGAFLPYLKRLIRHFPQLEGITLEPTDPAGMAGSIPASSGGNLTNEITTNKARVTPDSLVLQMNWELFFWGYLLTHGCLPKPLVWQNMPFCFWCLVLCLSSSRNFAKLVHPIQYLLVGFAILIFICCFYHYPSIWVSTGLSNLHYRCSGHSLYASAILSAQDGDFRVLGTFNLVWLSLCHSPIGKLCLANGKPRIFASLALAMISRRSTGIPFAG